MSQGQTKTLPRTVENSIDNLYRIVPVLAVAALVAWLFVYARAHHAWDDADPEILHAAWRLAQGKPIYHPITEPPFFHVAYPPLYFAVVAGVLKLTGLNFLAAEAVSFFSFLAAALAFAALARLHGRPATWGWWTAALALLVPAVLYNVARTHVQMMAVALTLWSLVFLLQEGFWRSAVLSPLLAVLALYTKQSQIALPAAAALWLLLRAPRRLTVYVLVGLISGLPALIWLERDTGGAFLKNILTWNLLPYEPVQIPLVILHHAGPLLPAVAIAALLWRRRQKQGVLTALDFYWVSAAIVMVITCGRAGAFNQYVVEFCLATLAYLLCIAGPAVLSGWRKLAAVQILVLAVYTPLFIFLEHGRFGLQSIRASRPVQRYLAGVRGPILSEQGSFPLMAQGQIHAQLFHFVSLARAGLWDENRLKSPLERGEYGAVITLFSVDSARLSADDKERFTPGMLQALRRRYRLARVEGPYYLYLPVR